VVDQRCAVYRCFDEDGVLLYVGSSVNPQKRWYNHRCAKYTWPQRCATRTIEWFDSTADAGVAEARAIEQEEPLYNERQPFFNRDFGSGLPSWFGVRRT